MNGIHLAEQDLALDEYRELAEFRHQIRLFQSAAERHARDLKVDPDLYLLLVTLQGLPEGVKPTIGGLAGRMCMKKEAVGLLIDAAVARNDLTRSSSDGGTLDDWVKLTRSGRDLLRRMATGSRDELDRTGPELVRALQSVVKQRRRHRIA